MVDQYNRYCTSQGCFEGVWRDDLDNGWPSWCGAWADGCCSAGTGYVGTPQVSCDGRLRPPPHWHYTIPQSQAQLDAACGPRGCGPVQFPVWSAFSNTPLPPK